MAKKTKNFTFTTPIIWGNKGPQRVELEISGVGCYYPDNEPGEEYEFDIDCVKADGQDFTNIFRVLKSDQDSRVEQTINDATMAHMAYIFSGECGMCVRGESTANRLQDGDLSSDSIFEAIAIITKGYKDTILATPLKKSA